NLTGRLGASRIVGKALTRLGPEHRGVAAGVLADGMEPEVTEPALRDNFCKITKKIPHREIYRSENVFFTQFSHSSCRPAKLSEGRGKPSSAPSANPLRCKRGEADSFF
ncbi:MAG: hypothetical protein J6J61_04950, partial [Muribaculaceae bacterium]|nr:hypothetical protein [Muribaculaceae bacterium]